jgi:hypothetical protein
MAGLWAERGRLAPHEAERLLHFPYGCSSSRPNPSGAAALPLEWNIFVRDRAGGRGLLGLGNTLVEMICAA